MNISNPFHATVAASISNLTVEVIWYAPLCSVTTLFLSMMLTYQPSHIIEAYRISCAGHYVSTTVKLFMPHSNMPTEGERPKVWTQSHLDISFFLSSLRCWLFLCFLSKYYHDECYLLGGYSQQDLLAKLAELIHKWHWHQHLTLFIDCIKFGCQMQ